MITKLKNSFRTTAFFILLLPLFFIYSGYNELFGFLTVDFVLVNFLVISAGIAFVFAIAYFFIRRSRQSVLFTFFLSAYLLLFGFIHDSLKKILPAGNFFTSFTFLIPFTIVAAALLLFYFKRNNANPFKDLFLYLNLLMVTLILSEIPNSIRRYRLDQSVHNLIDFRFKAASAYKTANLPDSSKPDIYFLLFDGMASTKSLMTSFGKDNSQLDSFLTTQGFYIARNATCNYNWTIHSLSTTMNMDYLPDFIAPVMNDPKAYYWGTNSILNNSLTTILKKEGYNVFQYQPISINNKDWPVEIFFEALKKQHFYFKTFPGRIYRDIFWNYTLINNRYVKEMQVSVQNNRYQRHKKMVETAYDLVKKSCDTSGKPKLVYGHFMIPHDPYIYTKEGKLKTITLENLNKKEFEPDAYFEQLQYANHMIKDLVQHIKTHNKKNTVIVVAGDHGFRDFKKSAWQNSFSNLNAFYFPDKNYTGLYDSISSVNTFRVVINTFLQGNLPLLKDSTIVVSGKNNLIISSKLQ